MNRNTHNTHMVSNTHISIPIYTYISIFLFLSTEYPFHLLRLQRFMNCSDRLLASAQAEADGLFRQIRRGREAPGPEDFTNKFPHFTCKPMCVFI